jgi:TPR repeat protein
LAFSYLIKAGNLGNAWAINTLMTEFFIGDKTPLNYEKALYWAKKLDKPNNRFYENACELMGIIYYEQGKYDNAFSYLRNTEKECLSPFPTVYLYLADCYFFGYGTSINYTYAIKNYIRLIDAFENDNWQATDDAIYAYKKLAYMYEEGLGVDQDFSRAFSYYMKAANYGDYFAASIVADYYFNGNRIEQDINRAIFWFEKSAQQNDAYSWYSLGWIYAREKFGHYNTSKAVECFNKAIKCDNDGTNSSSCYYELGRIYEYGGGGISKSYAKAGTYYKKAAELGHDKAKEKMKEFE